MDSQDEPPKMILRGGGGEIDTTVGAGDVPLTQDSAPTSQESTEQVSEEPSVTQADETTASKKRKIEEVQHLLPPDVMRTKLLESKRAKRVQGLKWRVDEWNAICQMVQQKFEHLIAGKAARSGVYHGGVTEIQLDLGKFQFEHPHHNHDTLYRLLSDVCEDANEHSRTDEHYKVPQLSSRSDFSYWVLLLRSRPPPEPTPYSIVGNSHSFYTRM
jgi:hypothetical protein